MGRTKRIQKKATSPGAVSPSRQANSAPTRSNWNVKLFTTKKPRKEPTCKPEATISQSPSLDVAPVPFSIASTVERIDDEVDNSNENPCDNNNGNSVSKDEERLCSKRKITASSNDNGDNIATSATTVTINNNNSSSSKSIPKSSKRQSTGFAKQGKERSRRRHSTNTAGTLPHHIRGRFSSSDPTVCLKISSQLLLWEPHAHRCHSASTTTTEETDTSSSTLQTPSATVYYSPAMADATETNAATLSADHQRQVQLWNNENLLRQQRLQKKQLEHSHPSDAVEYFRTNKTAWGYLRSATTGIQSYGLYDVDQKPFLPDQHSHTPTGYLIGSHHECDIRIPGLEHRHAYIYMNWISVNDGCRPVVHVMDRSTNGTFIDGEAIQKSTGNPIENGQAIQLMGENGKDAIKFQIYLPLQMIRYRVYKECRRVGDIYDIEDKKQVLGIGTFGLVCKATCRKTSRLLAIKKIQMRFQPDLVRLALCREVAINVCLKAHPCIIRLENVLEERIIKQRIDGSHEYENFIYMAMELGKDGDLFDWVSSLKGLSEEIVLVVFDQIFHAIAHLHSQGIAHRDLKPENVIVMDKKTFQVKLCDFGVASFQQNADSLFQTMCGTREYSAPELLFLRDPATELKGYSKSVDIWSLGMMLYVTFVSFSPYNAINGTLVPKETPDKIKDTATMKTLIYSKHFPNFDHPNWNSISNQGKDLIQKMLTADSRHRPDIGEVLSHPWAQRAPNSGKRNTELAAYLLKHNH